MEHTLISCNYIIIPTLPCAYTRLCMYVPMYMHIICNALNVLYTSMQGDSELHANTSGTKTAHHDIFTYISVQIYPLIYWRAFMNHFV